MAFSYYLTFLYRQLAHCLNVDDLLYRYTITQDQALSLLSFMEFGKKLASKSTVLTMYTYLN